MPATRSLCFLIGGLILLVCRAGPAQAATATWNGPNLNGIWNTAATNWTGLTGTPWNSTNGLSNKAFFATAGNTANVNGTVNAGVVAQLASGNTLQIAGTGTGLNAAEGLFVGDGTGVTGNHVIVSGGAILLCQAGECAGGYCPIEFSCIIGTDTGANNNSLTVTGTNSQLVVGGLQAGRFPVLLGGSRYAPYPSFAWKDARNNSLNVVSGASAVISTSVIVNGTNSAFNLGDGIGTSTATVGSLRDGGISLMVADARLNINAGKLIAAVGGSLVTGPGSVVLAGPAAISTSFATSTASSVISGSGSLTKEGAGTLALTAANTYSGPTTVANGTLKLGRSDALAAATSVNIEAGATLDVTDLTASSATYAWNTAALTANGTGTSPDTAAIIAGTPGGSIGMGTKPLTVTWNGAAFGTDNTHPPLTVSGANLTLGGNRVTVVVPGPALAAGVYTLVTAPAITGTVNPVPLFHGGNGLTGGATATVAISGGNRLILTVTGGNITFNVTYDGNGNTGGTPPADTTPHPFGSTVTVPDRGTLTKSGRVFAGWNTASDGSGTTYTAGSTFTIAANTTLYARWSLTFASWIANCFPDITDPAVIGPDADPDHDGMNNRREFAFGLNPASSSSSAPPLVAIDGKAGIYRYTRLASTTNAGLVYTLHYTTDLGSPTWPADAGASEQQVTRNGDIETVTVKISPALLTAPGLFLRVHAD